MGSLPYMTLWSASVAVASRSILLREYAAIKISTWDRRRAGIVNKRDGMVAKSE